MVTLLRRKSWLVDIFAGFKRGRTNTDDVEGNKSLKETFTPENILKKS